MTAIQESNDGWQIDDSKASKPSDTKSAAAGTDQSRKSKKSKDFSADHKVPKNGNSEKPLDEKKNKKPKNKKSDADQADKEAVDSVPNDHKLFVGNLDYSVTNEELETLFKQVSSTVKAKLVQRYGKSKGFAFLTFANHEEVEKAAEKFNNYELNGRAMNCEAARDIEKPKRKKDPKPKASTEEKPKESEEDKEAKPAKEKKTPREKKVAKQKEDSELSETMLFVGNLPFKMADNDLEQMFESYDVVSARIVTGKFKRSKGFGFVELSSHENQQKALNDFVDAEVNDRKLIVKAAYKTQVPE